MKFYATSIPQTLPTWATVVSNNAGLIEVEINEQDPGFHSIIEELSTEIEPGIIGVKASDLCQRLNIEMVDTNEEN
ncbi:hypothetical protein ANSO36C_64470 (plasmid) [Nostoc cf. commune SO-36]|uniref:Pyruvate/2-oxoglutarate dehydrogenase complex n=1 Tax=Nostoc cf. commune SO-36 TaxID=449208 RepID=A0ABN6QDI6_NOSCO|nr:hypothetical protein [Nostoc commune]BDI20645.1 hypothetical protein ANSO36C_64470 [Nostoc cf. commune SO-36]